MWTHLLLENISSVIFNSWKINTAKIEDDLLVAVWCKSFSYDKNCKKLAIQNLNHSAYSA